MPDSPNNKWVSVKIDGDKTAYFMPKNEPVMRKDSLGGEWKLREGTVAYPPEVQGVPALPSFATTGVEKVGALLNSKDGPQIKSNDPALIGAMTGATTEKIEAPVALGGLFGRKPPVSFDTIILVVLIVAGAWFVSKNVIGAKK